MLVRISRFWLEETRLSRGANPIWDEEGELVWEPVRDRQDLRAGDLIRDHGGCIVFEVTALETEAGKISDMELRPVGVISRLPEVHG